METSHFIKKVEGVFLKSLPRLQVFVTAWTVKCIVQSLLGILLTCSQSQSCLLLHMDNSLKDTNKELCNFLVFKSCSFCFP